MKRRQFIKAASATGVGLSIAGFPLHGKNAPNEKLVMGVIGLHGRGLQLAKDIHAVEGMEVGYLCDVDEEYLENARNEIKKLQGKKPEGFKDLRKMLELQDIDVVVIATPDHWHTPAAIMALQAGKNVYVEKPCGHNPGEGEMLVSAQKKYGKLVQMGNQQRSAPLSIEIIEEIHNGLIGRPYFGKAWYAANRGSIGIGKVVKEKPGLDFDLWQGPAPRTLYRDNIHPYNWHWFWRWGTGEICNNGTHEIDICRWALQADYPIKVTSSGGRYQYQDDWEFYDTQVASFEFEGRKSITWEGRSCNNKAIEHRGRGSLIYGTEGSVLIDRAGYEVYDMNNKKVREKKSGDINSGMSRTSGGSLTQYHLANMRDAVTKGAPLHSPIEEGAKSVLLCHLGNIAQKTGHELHTQPKTGSILDDPDAMKLWDREYEPGWKPQV